MKLTDPVDLKCKGCGESMSRVWVPLENGSQSPRWYCHWCNDGRTSALRVRLEAAERVVTALRRLTAEHETDGRMCEACLSIAAYDALLAKEKK